MARKLDSTTATTSPARRCKVLAWQEGSSPTVKGSAIKAAPSTQPKSKPTAKIRNLLRQTVPTLLQPLLPRAHQYARVGSRTAIQARGHPPKGA